MDTATTSLPPDRAAEREHHRAILNELIDLGADMARMVHRQKKVQHDYEVYTGTTVCPVPDRTAEFDQIMRCVRRTMNMLQHLDDLPKSARDLSFTRAHLQRTTRRDAVRDAARDETAEAAAEARPERDRAEELRERLDTPDWHERFDTSRPPEVIIAEIRRGLGLASAPAQPDLAQLSDAELDALKSPMARRWVGQDPPSDRTDRPERFHGIVAKPKPK